MLKLYPAKIPFFVPFLWPDLTYHKSRSENIIYLTFDDGPNPHITPFILDILKKKQVKASFFCTGKNIRNYPKLTSEIIRQNHQLGNHTYQHSDAWKTTTQKYLKEVLFTEKIIENHSLSKKIFRAPYGRLKPSIIHQLKKQGFDIIMWSILMGDFSQYFKPEYAIEYLAKHTKNGDILVFHDNKHSFGNLKEVLEPAITILKNKGFVFDTL